MCTRMEVTPTTATYQPLVPSVIKAIVVTITTPPQKYARRNGGLVVKWQICHL